MEYKYTNSPLVTYRRISPNRTSPRNHKIDTITIHCFVGQVTARSGCNASHFVNYDEKRGASCNYVVGYDGSIGLCVEEKDRSWCSSNRANDHRAITIEVASDTKSPYAVTDKALNSLINLITDICKRNGIKKLIWKGDKSLIGQVDKQNMTVHRWFANKACPGDYLYGKHSYIAEQVNKKLGVKTTTSSVSTIVKTNSIKTSFSSKLKIDSNIKAIQKWLNTNYKTGLSIDGIYGTKTKKALVKAWQKEVGGLTVDGIFGAKSKEASSSKILSNGSNGILVTIWQAYLVCKKYDIGKIDGIFGSKTYKSTIAFQKANKLTQDGKVGKNTWTKAFT